MENFEEMADVLRRVSLISTTKPEQLADKLSKEKHTPNDTLYLVRMLCLLFGALGILPMSFFVTANDYWMYKFRDPAKDTVDLNNKTTLEKYFFSGGMVVQSVPSVAAMLLSVTYGPRFKASSRILLSVTFVNAIFVVFTAFIKINTDTWQVAFFVLTLAAMSLLTGTLNLFQVTSTAIVSKFPPVYMKTFLFGQGIATIFSALMQILSLSLGTSTEASALFYFIVGDLIIFSTWFLHLFVQNTTFYKYYMHLEVEDTKKKHTREDIKVAFFRIWPCLAIMILGFVTMSMMHPTITTLVVSENYGNGNKWNDVYFIPTITYLFTELCSLFGRLTSRAIITKSNSIWVVGFVLLRMVILPPLVWFCNAQPRNHLPVLFPHDWEYILVLVLCSASSGYLMNAGMLSIRELAGDKEDVSYLIMLSVGGIFGCLLSPISLVIVHIL
ncbi:equilibrative nucleoside transporter 3-like [Anoplophora glabripennis]|uniref:equilibrative nucleoside transporter 3-like n=1 Tax=Anoplophora glabripennis TaxID=217634 RepID=UPI0008738AB5|nr:equilibrative nucleoside transporter 3-like [Anoplophora glabripennis]